MSMSKMCTSVFIVNANAGWRAELQYLQLIKKIGSTLKVWWNNLPSHTFRIVPHHWQIVCNYTFNTKINGGVMMISLDTNF